MSLPSTSMRRSRGVTLIELVIVILIIGLLMALLFPAIAGVRESAREAVCMSNMREVATAVQQYESAKNHYPGWRHFPFPLSNAGEEDIATTWTLQVLPQLQHNSIYEAFKNVDDVGKVPTDRLDSSGASTPDVDGPFIAILICPSDFEKVDSTGARTSIVANCGRQDVRPSFANPDPAASTPSDWRANAVFLDLINHDHEAGNENRRFKVLRQDSGYILNGDGLSHTLMLSENRDLRNTANFALRWDGGNGGTDANNLQLIKEGESINESQAAGFTFVPPSTATAAHRINSSTAGPRPSSYHSGGVNVIFCDTNGRKLNEEIDYEVFAALMTPKGVQAQDPGTQTASEPQIRTPNATKMEEAGF